MAEIGPSALRRLGAKSVVRSDAWGKSSSDPSQAFARLGRLRTMRSLREFILDGSWPRLMSRLREESPKLYYFVIALRVSVVAATAALGVYIDHRFH